MRILAALFLLVICATPAWAVEGVSQIPKTDENLFNDLSSKMACLCSCGATIKSCPHEKCSFAIPVRKEIRRMIESGLSRDEIKAGMVSSHGEVILALPEFKGFNIMAWVTPFILILIVGYGIVALVSKWSERRRPEKAEDTGADGAGGNDPFLKRMRSELERFED